MENVETAGAIVSQWLQRFLPIPQNSSQIVVSHLRKGWYTKRNGS